MRRANIRKDGTSDVNMLLAADPARKIPLYGWIVIAPVTKAFQDLFRSTRSGHHEAEGQWETINVPSSPPADMCFSTRGMRYGGGKSQLFSFDHETVKTSTDSHPGFRYRPQLAPRYAYQGSFQTSLLFFITKWRRTLILRNLILAHSRCSRCPGTTKILNAFNYFFVLNVVVNLLIEITNVNSF